MELVICKMNSMAWKALILNSNPSAYYVHCFTHKFQLTLVVVTKKHNECHFTIPPFTRRSQVAKTQLVICGDPMVKQRLGCASKDFILNLGGDSLL